MNTNPQPDALRSRWTLAGEIPLSGVADGAVWRRARSISTGEDVVLFIVQGEAALEAADAVRRAYLVEDPHLLPVRDIVVFDDPREDGDSAPDAEVDAAGAPLTVVEYPLPPAPPLAALLAEGPLHPETARAIIGEAATGLETARRRGVRHQLLDSNRVFVDTRSGDVVLLGIGVEAAAHPGLDRSREIASFQDTVALVALLYRALTGRSPRPDETGHVPRPSTLVDSEIPQDLDLLCDLVLNESTEDIPETTRGLIEALEPWQSIPVTLEAYSRAGTAAPMPVPGTASPEPDEDELESTALMTPVPDAAPSPAEEPPSSEETELESTALMAPVPDAAPSPAAESPSEDEGGPDAAEPDAAADAAVAAGAAGAAVAGAGGAAALSAAPVDPAAADPGSRADDSAGAREGEPSEDAAAAAQDAAASQKTSQEAKALVDDLQLDQKRRTSPFPGHLDITVPQGTQPARPSDAPAPAAGTGEEGDAGEQGASSPAGPAAAGAAATTAAAAAASQPPPAEDVPARTSGTHWPLAPAASSGEAPAGDAPAATPPAAAPAAPATTPDYSAPTPPSPVAHSAGTPSSAPVPVSGRTEPVASARPDGPIVIHGRDRSVLEETPEESSAAPASRSSLLRDVVGVAVDDDAPGTFAMGPRDREKRSLQSQWIIIGGAIVVMVALVIALTSITSDVRELLDDPLATSAPPASPTPAEEEETGEAPVEPTAEPTEDPAAPPPEIEDVELFVEDSDRDPDHTDQQDRLTDGDPSTYWSTKHYGSPDYGGLKGGVGMHLHFAETSTFSSVTVTTALNNGGTIELRALNDDGSLGDVLASGAFVADGEVRLDAPEPVETDEVTLWIPELPPDSNEDGRFRARIAEIQVE